MGNAFTKNSAVQQPPPVCRKGPGILPLPFPETKDLILQAFVDVRIPFTPGSYELVAVLELLPFPSLDMWLGNTTFPSKNVEVEILSNPATGLYSIEITAHVGVLPINSVLWTDVPPQTVRPFTMPMLTENLPVANEFWQIRILT